MNECPISLFKKIGGKDAIRATVIKLYGRILVDSLLSNFFDPNRIDILKRSQIAFMTMALGGPHTYTGKDLRAAHAHLVARGLSDKHFDIVVSHLSEVLYELKVPEPLIEDVLATVETTRNDVLSKA